MKTTIQIEETKRVHRFTIADLLYLGGFDTEQVTYKNEGCQVTFETQDELFKVQKVIDIVWNMQDRMDN